MPTKLLSLLLLLLLTSASSVHAEPSRFFDGTLEMEVPSLFRPLDEAALEQMFAKARTRPAVVLATPDSQTRVSMTYAETPLAVEALESTMQSLKTRMDSQEGLSWVSNEMVILHGHPWFRLDYDLTAASGSKREVIIGTSLHGRLLFLVMATPKDDQEMVEAEFQTMIESLRLREKS